MPTRSQLTLADNQGTSEDRKRSPSLTINDLPVELLLEIFDAYRQQFRDDTFGLRWNWNRWPKWFNLMHVCRKWRCVVFTSSSRLDLCLLLTTRHGGHMKTILSPRLPPLPIIIDYSSVPLTPKDASRLRSALRRHDRVCELTFAGSKDGFSKFFKDTKRHFPILERLELSYASTDTLDLPAKFLGGSTPHLKYLGVNAVVFGSIAQILSSATALVELNLGTDTPFGPSTEESLPAYLQAMPCLRSLSLMLSRLPTGDFKLAQPTNSEGVVPLTMPKLKHFHYDGPCVVLNALLGRLTVPSLQGLSIWLDGEATSPVSHLSRFIDDVDKKFHFVQLGLYEGYSRISLLTESGVSTFMGPRVPHFKFQFNSKSHPESIMRMSNVLSTKLTTVKHLLITFKKGKDTSWNDVAMWQRFLRLFRNAKVLRLERDAVHDIANCLEPTFGDSVLASRGFLPSLEVIELCAKETYTLKNESVSAELAAFRSFASARKQAGRPIEVKMKTRFEAY